MRLRNTLFYTLGLLSFSFFIDIFTGAVITLYAQTADLEVTDVYTKPVLAADNSNFANDLYLKEEDIRLLKDDVILNQTVRIYGVVHNGGKADLTGVVRFYDELTVEYIGTDQPISVVGGKTDDVFVDWTPDRTGAHTIAIRVKPTVTTGDNTDNNKVRITIFVDNDLDGDGIGNRHDPDIDGDGILNAQDAFPFNPKEWKDTDGDGIGDNADLDDDNDGVPDVQDAFPTDPKEWADENHNGIGDNAEKDADKDGIPDVVEVQKGINPLLADTDSDGVNDKEDAFPLDPKEWKDTDHDGLGDNMEIQQGTNPLLADTDSDGVNDKEDAFSLDPKEWKDTDHDGLGDNADPNNNNKAPLPVIEPTQSTINPRSITFNALKSKDPDGIITNYFWDFGDGVKAEGVVVDHRYSKPGVYKVFLKATDNQKESQTTSLLVTARRGWVVWALIGVTALLILLFLLRSVFPLSPFKQQSIKRPVPLQKKSLPRRKK
ncbi:thrombospondin type 3 repeat-containing protein [Candidatus Peregrinibacteria bacterium]|nr:thrombospondin type 3 repeat-containing protein [Candidatus Peregrinibacteria bacterium]